MKTVYSEYSSPIGLIYVVMSNEGLKRVLIASGLSREYLQELQNIQRDNEACLDTVKQIDEYFTGRRCEFTIPLAIEGPEFYKKVWERLQTIPFGETRSYGEIAVDVGSPKAVRAVGQANRRNPLPIIIPCHRVIGKNGNLTGYLGSSVDIKKELIQLEQRFAKSFV